MTGDLVNRDFYWGIDMSGDAPLQKLYRRAVAHRDWVFALTAGGGAWVLTREFNHATDLIRKIVLQYTGGSR